MWIIQQPCDPFSDVFVFPKGHQPNDHYDLTQLKVSRLVIRFDGAMIHATRSTLTVNSIGSACMYFKPCHHHPIRSDPFPFLGFNCFDAVVVVVIIPVLDHRGTLAII